MPVYGHAEKPHQDARKIRRLCRSGASTAMSGGPPRAPSMRSSIARDWSGAAAAPPTASAPSAIAPAPSASTSAPPAPSSAAPAPPSAAPAGRPASTPRRDARGEPPAKSAANCAAGREDRYPCSRRSTPFENDRPSAVEDVIPERIRRKSHMAGPCIHGVGGCAWGVVNTDLLPRHLPFLPSGRGDESLKPPPAVHGAGFFIEVASSKGFELLAQIHPVLPASRRSSDRRRRPRAAEPAHRGSLPGDALQLSRMRRIR